MEILSQAHLLITHNGEFGINTDIFETNIINQLILIPIVIYAYSAVGIDKTLEKRRENIIKNIENSEKRLIEATQRLEETKKQLSQAYLIFEEIQQETKVIKSQLLDTEYLETKNELTRKFNISTKNLKNKERLILLEIKEKISFLVLKKVINDIKFEKNISNYNFINSFMQKSLNSLKAEKSNKS